MPRDHHALAFQGAINQLREPILGFDDAMLAHTGKVAIRWLFCKPRVMVRVSMLPTPYT